ncbi:MAG: protein translocase SEC61 complex subunit gamma [archaeon]|nr:protein translocase SEC61 complex subunit gamma [archaeon]
MEEVKQSGLKIFYNKCVRVWKTLKKPTRKEFEMTAKVSAIGIAILGVIGFIIALLMTAAKNV